MSILNRKAGKSLFLLFIWMIIIDTQVFSQPMNDATKRTVKVAMIQMKVVGGQLDENLARAELLVREAAAKGAAIAVLPECMDLGWTHPSSLVKATAIPNGEVFARLSKLARKHSIFICSGLTERDGDKVYNAAVLIDNKGKLLMRHRKINELDIGKPYYSTGDRINVVDTSLGRIGLMICADASLEDRSIITSLARMEPNIILSPSAWAVPPGYDNIKEPYGALWRNAYQPVSQNFGVYIISASNVGMMNDGPWKGWDCIGASLAFDNKGNEMLQCPYGVAAETIMYIDCKF
jgi:predicted amidohydrolase